MLLVIFDLPGRPRLQLARRARGVKGGAARSRAGGHTSNGRRCQASRLQQNCACSLSSEQNGARMHTKHSRRWSRLVCTGSVVVAAALLFADARRSEADKPGPSADPAAIAVEAYVY